MRWSTKINSVTSSVSNFISLSICVFLHPTVYSERRCGWQCWPTCPLVWIVSLRKPPAKASHSPQKIQVTILKGKTKVRHGKEIVVLVPPMRKTKDIVAVHNEDMPSLSQFPASIHLVRTHPLHTISALDFLLQFGDSERYLLSPCLSTPLNLLGT